MVWSPWGGSVKRRRRAHNALRVAYIEAARIFMLLAATPTHEALDSVRSRDGRGIALGQLNVWWTKRLWLGRRLICLFLGWIQRIPTSNYGSRLPLVGSRRSRRAYHAACFALVPPRVGEDGPSLPVSRRSTPFAAKQRRIAGMPHSGLVGDRAGLARPSAGIDG